MVEQIKLHIKMKTFKQRFVLAILVTAICGIAQAQDNPAYQQEIENWHAQRINNLKAENGWLNLVGLYWLDEGKNSFGSSKENKVVFPVGTIAEKAGYFVRAGNTVKLVPAEHADIKINNKGVSGEVVIFNDSSRALAASSGDLRWTIIKRDNRIGVRLRNLKSATALNFKGVDRFTVYPFWKIAASLQKENHPGTILITNVLGQTNAQQSPGKLVFTVNGKPYSLDALEEGDELFVIFADSTSGNSTYPSGRFLSVKKPGSDGTTIIDFNKAYNPPCAFTDFATCPLPPKQNVLSLAVTAGEKYSGHH
jgi:hypothetical protein